MNPRSAEDQLDIDLVDAVAGLFARLLAEAEQLAKEYEVPAFFLKALHLIDAPLAMKELGSRMHCDPSFVTGIADLLEQRELAVREPDPADRRVKRLVLTPAGEELRRQLEAEILARLPWRQALDGSERACLLGHLTAAVRSLREQAPAPARTAKGVSADLTMPQPGDSIA